MMARKPIPLARLQRLEAERLQRQAERAKRLSKRRYMVYFLLCEGFVKIGYGNDPEQRCRAAQVGNPFPVTLIAVALGGKTEEVILHRAFRNLHVRAEWFRLAPPLDHVVANLRTIDDPRAAMEWLGEWLLATKGSFALLKAAHKPAHRPVDSSNQEELSHVS